MSNFLAIATVTATLGQLLRADLGRDVPGAEVSTVRPDSGAKVPAVGVNAYLYQVLPNAALRNADLPTRGPAGDLVQRPRVALDLHYLLTMYGDETDLQAQRVMGSVVRTLHSQPVLTRQRIQATVANSSFSFLSGSNLAGEIETVKFAPLALTLEEIAKFWSVLLQTTYTLSVAYMASVVLIEPDASFRSPLPVRERAVYAVSFRRIVIEQINSESGAGQPILAGSRIAITGSALRGDDTVVMIDDTEVTPASADLSDTTVVIALPPTLRAGVHGLSVQHRISMGTPATPHRSSESNQAAFVLQPAVTRTNNTYDIVFEAADPAAVPPVAATVTVTVNPKVGSTQKAVLQLNQPGAARAYSIIAQPFPAAVTASSTLVFPVRSVAPGEYLVRVEVDRAASPLDTGPDGAFIGPKVTVA